ncbi:MAG: hypothetical protein ACYC4N_22420, partial [Pirellulaceae bacterium]
PCGGTSRAVTVGGRDSPAGGRKKESGAESPHSKGFGVRRLVAAFFASGLFSAPGERNPGKWQAASEVCRIAAV